MTARTYGTYWPTLAEFKAHIRLTTSDMDTDLTAKLLASIRAAEHYIGKVIAQSTFVYSGSFVNSLPLEGPVISVSSVVVDGETSTDWTLSGDTLAIGGEGETITVTYSAGMVAEEPDIKAAVLLHAAALFNNPVDSVETLPKASSRLLAPYRTWGVK